MRIDAHGHVRSRVPGEVLNFFHVKAGLDPAGDAGMPKQMRMHMKVQRVDDVRMSG